MNSVYRIPRRSSSTASTPADGSGVDSARVITDDQFGKALEVLAGCVTDVAAVITA